MNDAARLNVLTVEEAAEVLRISRNSAYQAVQRGDIPSVRVGRTIRVPRAALARMLEGGDAEAVIGAALQP